MTCWLEAAMRIDFVRVLRPTARRPRRRRRHPSQRHAVGTGSVSGATVRGTGNQLHWRVVSRGAPWLLKVEGARAAVPHGPRAPSTSNDLFFSIYLKPRLHDTTGCQTGPCLSNRLTTGLTTVLNEQ